MGFMRADANYVHIMRQELHTGGHLITGTAEPLKEIIVFPSYLALDRLPRETAETLLSDSSEMKSRGDIGANNKTAFPVIDLNTIAFLMHILHW